MLEYSKTIGNLLGNPDSPPALMIEDPKTILKVSISICCAYILLVTWYPLIHMILFNFKYRKYFIHFTG